MLPEKWRRIMIAAAGMYVELVISAVAILVWWSTHPGLVHFLALQTFLVTVCTTVLLNANPLLQFDGYYILSDVLEIPNLRAKADRLCAQFLARICFGIESPLDPFMPQTGRMWFVMYSAASMGYRLSLLLSISYFLYQVLHPYGLHHLSLLSAAAILVRMGMNAVRQLTAPRIRPMSLIRTTATAVIATTAVAALVCVPIPVRTELPFVVSPHGVRPVYASTAGQLATITVKPGQFVESGEVLLELTNFTQEDRLARLRTAHRVQKIELALQRKLNDAAGIRIAGELLTKLEEQIGDYERQAARLQIVAPCSGTVVAPPAVRQPAGDHRREPAPHWSGTPLAPGNVGAWIETGTHVLSVAPTTRCDALVVIEQHQRDELDVGCAVELKCDFQPAATWTGSLVAIAGQHIESVSTALSNKFGGPVPTVTASDGRERLMIDAFQGIVELPAGAPALLSGMQGRARFTVSHRTAAQWLWRYLRTTFHFRM
jgi:putative peptide zinc metalloprotease protein